MWEVLRKYGRYIELGAGYEENSPLNSERLSYYRASSRHFYNVLEEFGQSTKS